MNQRNSLLLRWLVGGWAYSRHVVKKKRRGFKQGGGKKSNGPFPEISIFFIGISRIRTFPWDLSFESFLAIFPGFLIKNPTSLVLFIGFFHFFGKAWATQIPSLGHPILDPTLGTTNFETDPKTTNLGQQTSQSVESCGWNAQPLKKTWKMVLKGDGSKAENGWLEDNIFL